jgi:excinuclease ABC subunit C
VFAELGIADIPTIGLAESQETIVLDDGRDDINLERDSQALMVITRLRDEAHRFAITYHKSLRDKAIRESVLDEVTGIGEAKKMKLLKKFRSVYGIARASAEEIAAAAGVNETVAAEVLKAVSQLTRKGD